MDISHCGLPALPPIAHLTALEELDCSYNSLGERGAAAPLAGLTSLTVLSLEHCELAVAPTELAGLSRLRRLSMKHNDNLGGAFAFAALRQLGGLVWLDLLNCPLVRRVPAELRALVSAGLSVVFTENQEECDAEEGDEEEERWKGYCVASRAQMREYWGPADREDEGDGYDDGDW